MTDRDLELLLEEEISRTPPTDDLVEFITPWRRAVRRILVGMGLCGITLNFFLLDHILPAIGVMLILLGFRSLRRENRWFFTGYVVAICRTALNILYLIVNATVWQSDFYASALAPWLTGLGISFTILQALCVWGGFRAVQEKAGTEQTSRGFWLVVYYVLLSVLGLAGFQGSLVILGLLVIYILLLRSLWRYSRVLEDAGYAVQASPLRVSDRTAAILLTVIVLLGILCGYLLCNQYPMDWTVQEPVSAEAEAVRSELLALGFPEDMLEDLAEEDILACRGAAAVHVNTHDFGIHEHEYDPAADAWYDYQRLHEEELRMTEIAVEIPGERRSFVLFHHFLWRSDPGYQGCDAIQIWNTDRLDGWHMTRDITGQVLHDRDGVSHASSFHEIRQTSDIETVVSFSLPRQAENRRGYVTYTVEEIDPGWLLDSAAHYYHHESPLLYPVQTAADIIRPGFGGVGIDYSHWFSDYWTQIQMVGYQGDDGIYKFEFTTDY